MTSSGSSSKRPIMTLYSEDTCPYSHRVRIVLAEKAMEYQIISVDPSDKPEDLADLNPYNQVPTLADRDLVVHEANVINEYLDERFPHPPLMPGDPVARAKARLMMLRFDRDWFAPLFNGAQPNAKIRQAVRDSLTAIAPLFSSNRFVMGEEFSLVDCAIAPLLWRLPDLGIQLPAPAKPLLDYMERIFARDSFRQSLTAAERRLRP